MFLFNLTSCSSDSDDSPVIIEDPITYGTDIAPIMSASCTFCHGNPTTNGAPMSLNTFATVKDAVENRSLIGAVESGFMPPNGELSAAQIQKIKDWQSAGFPQ